MSFLERLMSNVERLRPEDRPALVEFQRAVFGPNAAQLDELQYNWLFQENPYNDDQGPQIWIYRKNDRIVGEQAGIPFEMKIGAESVRASWAIDLMVADEFRQRGIGVGLSEVYTRTNALTVGIGITDDAYNTFRRAGWMDLGDIPLYVRPLNIGRMFAGRGSTGLRSRMAAYALQPGVRLADVTTEFYSKHRRVTMQQVEHFDERIDEVWATASGDYAIIARRDYRSLSWRFDCLPEPQRYTKYYLWEGTTLRGYAVLRVGVRHGVDAGIIVDFLCGIPWLRALFARCVGCFRRMGVAAVYCAAPHREVGRRLSALGFLRRSSDTHLMARQGPGMAAPPDIIAEPGNWFVTSADSDADHPRQKEGVEPVASETAMASGRSGSVD